MQNNPSIAICLRSQSADFLRRQLKLRMESYGNVTYILGKFASVMRYLHEERRNNVSRITHASYSKLLDGYL